jgi:hypothetical protein
MAAVAAIVNPNPFQFLSRGCYADQTEIGINSGMCFNCPTMLPSLEIAQRQANEDAAKVPQRPNVANRAKSYSGNNPYIVKWTSYAQCYGKRGQPHQGFENPFYYHSISTVSEAFNTGKNVGAVSQISNNNNNNPRPRRNRNDNNNNNAGRQVLDPEAKERELENKYNDVENQEEPLRVEIPIVQPRRRPIPNPIIISPSSSSSSSSSEEEENSEPLSGPDINNYQPLSYRNRLRSAVLRNISGNQEQSHSKKKSKKKKVLSSSHRITRSHSHNRRQRL